jgi:hypothetical protein
LTTFAVGKARWICSPRESVFETYRDGGMPPETSSGFAMSIRTLPSRFSSPAALRASSEPAPFVAFTTSLPAAAASANVPSPIRSFPCFHAVNGSFPIESGSVQARSASTFRVPIVTSWPSSASRAPITRPTVPVPRTPIFMVRLLAIQTCLGQEVAMV